MGHIDDIELIRLEAFMLIATIRFILGRIVRATRNLNRAHARKRSNAMNVCHLATLPAYLHRDIGLPDDADIAAVVERGLVRRAADGSPRRTLAILPHAV